MPNCENKLLRLLGAKDAPSSIELAIFRRAQKWCRWAKWIPGLRMIAVCNSATFFAADADSDIDLFVITAPRRLWLVRCLLTAFFQVCGVRRHGKKVVGRFCLSFFCTTDAMDFSKIALPDGDPYLEAWIPRMVPVLDLNGTADAFWNTNEKWAPTIVSQRITNRKRGGIFSDQTPAAMILKRKPGICQKILADFFDIIENILQKIFLTRTLQHWEKMGRPWGVVVTKSMLKFHDKDQRKVIQEKMRAIL